MAGLDRLGVDHRLVDALQGKQDECEGMLLDSATSYRSLRLLAETESRRVKLSRLGRPPDSETFVCRDVCLRTLDFALI
jgi:hypothetical protein